MQVKLNFEKKRIELKSFEHNQNGEFVNGSGNNKKLFLQILSLFSGQPYHSKAVNKLLTIIVNLEFQNLFDESPTKNHPFHPAGFGSRRC